MCWSSHRATSITLLPLATIQRQFKCPPAGISAATRTTMRPLVMSHSRVPRARILVLLCLNLGELRAVQFSGVSFAGLTITLQDSQALLTGQLAKPLFTQRAMLAPTPPVKSLPVTISMEYLALRRRLICIWATIFKAPPATLQLNTTRSSTAAPTTLTWEQGPTDYIRTTQV